MRLVRTQLHTPTRKRLWILQIVQRRVAEEESGSKLQLLVQTSERRQIKMFAHPARQTAVSGLQTIRCRRRISALGLRPKLFLLFQVASRFTGGPVRLAAERTAMVFALRKTETTTQAALWNFGYFRILPPLLRLFPRALRKAIQLRLAVIDLAVLEGRWFSKIVLAAMWMRRPLAVIGPTLP